MFERKTKVLVVLSAILCATLLVSNILATKIWDLCGIPVDGGLIIFPLSYIVSDLLVELYGRKIADVVVAIAVVINAVMMTFFFIAVGLPPYPGWEGQEAFASILEFSMRITGASLLSFLLSNLMNSLIFIRVEERQKKTGYRIRALLSSLGGRLVDVIVFEVIAFIGVLPFADFMKQAVGAYIEGQLVELAILMTIAKPTMSMLWRYINTPDTPIKE